MRSSAIICLGLAACSSSAGPSKVDDPADRAALEYEPPPPEVATVLREISDRVTTYFNENERFPGGKASATPRASCCVGSDRFCPATPEAWERGVWSDMGFALDDPSQFRYAYQGSRRNFTITAVGDPDCTGAVRTYVLTGRSTSRGRYELDDVAMLQVE